MGELLSSITPIQNPFDKVTILGADKMTQWGEVLAARPDDLSLTLKHACMHVHAHTHTHH